MVSATVSRKADSRSRIAVERQCEQFGARTLQRTSDRVLDRTANMSVAAEARPGEVPRVARAGWWRRVTHILRSRWRFLVAQGSSSLTRRIVLLNVAGL